LFPQFFLPERAEHRFDGHAAARRLKVHERHLGSWEANDEHRGFLLRHASVVLVQKPTGGTSATTATALKGNSDIATRIGTARPEQERIERHVATVGTTMRRTTGHRADAVARCINIGNAPTELRASDGSRHGHPRR
jgi:hypothetical protein